MHQLQGQKDTFTRAVYVIVLWIKPLAHHHGNKRRSRFEASYNATAINHYVVSCSIWWDTTRFHIFKYEPPTHRAAIAHCR